MPWRNLLLNNLWWKLLALALALMIWSGAQRLDVRPVTGPFQPLVARTFQSIPIRVLASPDQVRPVLLDPPTVRLDVAGEAAVVQRLSPEDALVYIALPDGGRYDASTNTVEIRLPVGVKLLSVLPARVIVLPTLPQ